MNRIKKLFEDLSENKAIKGLSYLVSFVGVVFTVISSQDTQGIKHFPAPFSDCKFKENIKESNYKGKLTIQKNHNPEDIKKYISIYKNFQSLETKNGYKKLNSLFQNLENISTTNEEDIEISGCLRTNKGIFYITKSSYNRSSKPIYISIND